MRDKRSLYITWDGHPKYKEGEILVDDPIRIIVNKIEMVLFSNKGSFIGDVNFGADIEFYLWRTNVSVEFIKEEIQTQFDTYIPELRELNHTIDVNIQKGSLKDILLIDITINDIGINLIFR